MEKETSCAFTGHRDSKLPWGTDETDSRCLALKERISDAVRSVYDGGVRHFLCGMATGCDMYFCEAVFALREEHPEVTVEAAVPFEGQSRLWSAALRSRYDRLCSECDFLTVVQADFTPECYMRRNRYMVDSASVLIAAYDGHAGGTQSTILYAIRQGLTVIELPIT